MKTVKTRKDKKNTHRLGALDSVHSGLCGDVGDDERLVIAARSNKVSVGGNRTAKHLEKTGIVRSEIQNAGAKGKQNIPRWCGAGQSFYSAVDAPF